MGLGHRPILGVTSAAPESANRKATSSRYLVEVCLVLSGVLIGTVDVHILGDIQSFHHLARLFKADGFENSGR